MTSNEDKTLEDFYLQNPDCKAYELLDQLVSVMEQLKSIKIRKSIVAEQAKLLLKSMSVDDLFKIICVKSEVDIKHVLNIKSGSEDVLPTLILQVLCFVECYKSLPLVAKKLKIETKLAQDVFAHMQNIFAITHPISWLKELQAKTAHERFYCAQCKQELQDGNNISTENLNLNQVEIEHKFTARKVKPKTVEPEVIAPEDNEALPTETSQQQPAAQASANPTNTAEEVAPPKSVTSASNNVEEKEQVVVTAKESSEVPPATTEQPIDEVDKDGEKTVMGKLGSFFKNIISS